MGVKHLFFKRFIRGGQKPALGGRVPQRCVDSQRARRGQILARPPLAGGSAERRAGSFGSAPVAESLSGPDQPLQEQRLAMDRSGRVPGQVEDDRRHGGTNDGESVGGDQRAAAGMDGEAIPDSGEIDRAYLPLGPPSRRSG